MQPAPGLAVLRHVEYFACIQNDSKAYVVGDGSWARLPLVRRQHLGCVSLLILSGKSRLVRHIRNSTSNNKYKELNAHLWSCTYQTLAQSKLQEDDLLCYVLFASRCLH